MINKPANIQLATMSVVVAGWCKPNLVCNILVNLTGKGITMKYKCSSTTAKNLHAHVSSGSWECCPSLQDDQTTLISLYKFRNRQCSHSTSDAVVYDSVSCPV